MQLESDLDSELNNAPTGVANHAHLLAGKKSPSFNALKHGLTAQNLILTFEDFPLYLQMGLDYMRELKPVGVRETANASSSSNRAGAPTASCRSRAISSSTNSRCPRKPARPSSAKVRPAPLERTVKSTPSVRRRAKST
jgi:hypothetical protein